MSEIHSFISSSSNFVERAIAKDMKSRSSDVYSLARTNEIYSAAYAYISRSSWCEVISSSCVIAVCCVLPYTFS